MEKLTEEQKYKLQLEVDEEWLKRVAAHDVRVEKFMNIENGKNLKLKLKVLKALNAGKNPEEIDGYYKVVLIPKGIWD